jgi:hypothetical protein
MQYQEREDRQQAVTRPGLMRELVAFHPLGSSPHASERRSDGGHLSAGRSI